MDHHPQSYQSLSHALQMPTSSGPPSYSAPTSMTRKETPEEEEEEGDDEGMVAQQLHQTNDHEHSRSPSPKAPDTQPDQSASAPSSRRRGRPKGSRNRGAGNARAGTTAPQAAGPPQFPEVTPQNQMYYEFQWRVLNLCSEFYGAAEELVKSTQPMVIAQCYKMTANPVDPMVMINEAKRICDTLLATPSKLISDPPPPMYPVTPQYYNPHAYMAPAPVASTSTGKTAQGQSYAVPIAPVYNPSSQYTSSYSYQYPGYPASAYYTMQSQTQQPQPQQAQSSPVPSGSNEPHIVSNPVAGVGSNQGTWSDEETERLKKLVQDSKDAGYNGDGAWDWVVSNWGKSRTRHQILIRLTSLGLKESSTRLSKRKRDTDDPENPSAPGNDTSPPNVPDPSPTLQPPSGPPKTPWQIPASTSNMSTANSTSYNLNSYRPRPSTEASGSKPPSASYSYGHHGGSGS